MSKICKSCGEYYNGDYCEKCGYGKPDVTSKQLEKYKQTTKPERFMTDEEKKEYYDKQREKRENAPQTKKHSTPKDRKTMLILIIVVAIGVIIAVLASSGKIFSEEKTEVIYQYFNSMNDRDFDKFADCFPSDMKKDYLAERKELDYSKEEYMDAFMADFVDEYGENFNIKITCGKEEELKDDMDMSEYKAAYGKTPNIREAYVVVVEATFSGSEKEEPDVFRYNCYVGKVGMSWKIFNLEYNAGTIKS